MESSRLKRAVKISLTIWIISFAISLAMGIATLHPDLFQTREGFSLIFEFTVAYVLILFKLTSIPFVLCTLLISAILGTSWTRIRKVKVMLLQGILGLVLAYLSSFMWDIDMSSDILLSQFSLASAVVYMLTVFFVSGQMIKEQFPVEESSDTGNAN